MSRYIRSQQSGGTFFFTVVAFHRKPIFTAPHFRLALRQSIHAIRQQHPFIIDAWVLLPDHLHCIWTLPENDNDFSTRWGKIKANTSKRLKPEVRQQNKRHESTIWQRRFWEHQIRDEEDYKRHMDYLIYNPVKHGLVDRVRDWPFSSFHRLVREGVFPVDWAASQAFDGQFGE